MFPNWTSLYRIPPHQHPIDIPSPDTGSTEKYHLSASFWNSKKSIKMDFNPNPSSTWRCFFFFFCVCAPILRARLHIYAMRAFQRTRQKPFSARCMCVCIFAWNICKVSGPSFSAGFRNFRSIGCVECPSSPPTTDARRNDIALASWPSGVWLHNFFFSSFIKAEI